MDAEKIADPALSDTDVLDRAAAQVAVPRREEGDSFVLHAPLELLARSALLTLAEPTARPAIRDRITTVAASYDAWGTPVTRRPTPSTAIRDDATNVLRNALRQGDLDGADDAITWLAATLDTPDLVRVLAGPVLPSLSAAAHGSILLYLLPRVAARSGPAATMARTTVHELARHPDWKLTWFDTGDRAGTLPPDEGRASSAEAELTTRILKPELAKRPTTTFIFPTMAAVEASGLADDLLPDLLPHLTLPGARRSLLRVAAQSMLQDDQAHAPYGWTHCLTMPQAALGVAAATGGDPTDAIAVAATYVLGFRSTLCNRAVDPRRVPEPTTLDTWALLDAPPPVAAAAAWHAPVDDHRAIWRALAANAGAHEDAHLAKYTLACLDATRADPEQANLYRAAAAHLNAWWTHNTP